MSEKPENTVSYKLPDGTVWSFVSPEPKWKIRITTFHMYLLLVFHALLKRMGA